ncbi:protein TIFY 5A-like protein [Carex littledalei]|uniref:Protein TIFY n=1 Tax=Carex littledalei TaxID=544730 RepID=A0A833QYB6_9POAL|nr:protein TIFY 5A-like protein [Carex littledalei]
MVGFDLDPELRLSLHTGYTESTSSSEKHATDTRDEICNGKASDDKRTVTIFYDGQMCTSNVTEIQGRAIISMAKREMEKGRSKELKERTNMYPLQFLSQFHSNSSQMLNQGLSMKQSLQRFLQKRRTRIASASPYSS